ncbi:nucleolar transcription factor 1-like [Stigmatopora argus]
MENAWTDESLARLRYVVKRILKKHQTKALSNGVNAINWEKVAFPPFSAKDCLEKWQDLSRKADLQPPKRPGHPKLIFYNENFSKYQELHPDFSRKKLFALITDKYKALTEEEKAPYVEKYHRAHAEYTKLRKKAKDGLNASEKEMTCPDSTDGAPPLKPPMSGYNLFCKEQVGSMQGIPKKDYVRAWAQRWHQLNDAEKRTFATRCFQMKQDYKEKSKDYLTKLKNTQKDTRPSDSEDDEHIVISSSSDEEEAYFNCKEDDENDHVDNISFDVF